MALNGSESLVFAKSVARVVPMKIEIEKPTKMRQSVIPNAAKKWAFKKSGEAFRTSTGEGMM